MPIRFGTINVLLAILIWFASGLVTLADVPVTQPAIPGGDNFRYAGRVVDSGGLPIQGVKVTATHRDAGRTSYGYIDEVMTDSNGDFTINRRRGLSGITLNNVKSEENVIRLEFSHADYEYGRLEDLSLYDTEAATHLKVALRAGRSLEGVICDPAGIPVEAASVEIEFSDLQVQRKAAITDAKGHFRLNGLPSLDGTINVLAVESGHPMLTAQMHVRAREISIGPVHAKAIDLPPGKIHKVLGMQLIDVDGAIQTTFHLGTDHGVMILDPGLNSERFNIGTLKTGDTFWVVGNDEVKNFAEFRQHLLDESKGHIRMPFA